MPFRAMQSLRLSVLKVVKMRVLQRLSPSGAAGHAAPGWLAHWTASFRAQICWLCAVWSLPLRFTCGARVKQRRVTSPSFWPLSSCCRAICATLVCISATCSVRSMTWKNWFRLKPSLMALPTGRVRLQSRLEMARSHSITSPSITATTQQRFIATSRSRLMLVSVWGWSVIRVRARRHS